MPGRRATGRGRTCDPERDADGGPASVRRQAPHMARPAADARSAIGEEGVRIHRLALDHELIVEVRSGALPTAADLPDDLALRHLLAALHLELPQVSVERAHAVAVIEQHVPAVVAAGTRQHD